MIWFMTLTCLFQYHLVKEALHERANVLESAPHIANPLPILLPVYKYTTFIIFLSIAKYNIMGSL